MNNQSITSGMKRLGRYAIIMLAIIPAFLFTPPESSAALQEERHEMSHAKARMDAPEFPLGLTWLNTEVPLSLSALRGKIVLLDFWTYCCINCMHIIPDLKKLEEKYPEELVVIGVHSAKFTTEKESENIRQAVLRYGIEHPVVNDSDMRIWQQYNIRAWPSLVLIDPEGKIIGGMSGEGAYEILDPQIQKAVETFDAEGKLDRTPLQLKLEKERESPSPLDFPGKVLAHEATNQLFIADSNNNRILVLSSGDASLQDMIGSGEPGLTDGGFDEAMFNHPQGMAYDEQFLYVADTENHAIRRIDFQERTVTTIAGTGEQTHRFDRKGPADEMALTSPWDLVLHDHMLYIAMAGSHQIWRMDLRTGVIGPHAGSGREDLIDGPLAHAALAQPSGLTTDGKKLYFADSEVSAIRSADLDPGGGVSTLIGGGLFQFGDKDGTKQEARLQHPLGIVFYRGALYVADTYNNKIKRLTLREPTIETLFGTGEGGFKDGNKEEAMFDEPGGLSAAHGKLYIADTNNHAIRVADLKTGSVETLEIKGLDERKEEILPPFQGDVLELPEQAVAPGDGHLQFSLTFPEGFKLNEEAPSSVAVGSSAESVIRFNGQSAVAAEMPTFPLSIPFQAETGIATLRMRLVLYSCEIKKEGLCFPKQVQMLLPVKVMEGQDSHQISVSYTVPNPFE